MVSMLLLCSTLLGSL